MSRRMRKDDVFGHRGEARAERGFIIRCHRDARRRGKTRAGGAFIQNNLRNRSMESLHFPIESTGMQTRTHGLCCCQQKRDVPVYTKSKALDILRQT